MTAKDLVVKAISSADANRAIRRLHYSGKVVNNSQLHLGVFLDGRLEGVMQFGPSLDKRKMLTLVQRSTWNSFLELNRLAFSDRLPRNSESRALAVAFRLIRKHYPHVEWIVSFADGTQCGDGTIYRASGFVLTGLKPSFNLCRLPDGTTIHKMTLESGPTRPRPELAGRSYYTVTGGKYDFRAYVAAAGGTILPGYQLRYVYFLNPAARARLTVPLIPFARIAEVGASMYRGQKRAGSIRSDASPDQGEEEGASPIPALQSTAATASGESPAPVPAPRGARRDSPGKSASSRGVRSGGRRKRTTAGAGSGGARAPSRR